MGVVDHEFVDSWLGVEEDELNEGERGRQGEEFSSGRGGTDMIKPK